MSELPIMVDDKIITIVDDFLSSDYSDTKKYYFVTLAMSAVISYLNMNEFPSDNDAVVNATADIALRLIKADSSGIGILKSRTIEGYAETFIDSSDIINDFDRKILDRFVLFHPDFNSSEPKNELTLPIYPGGNYWIDPYYYPYSGLS